MLTDRCPSGAPPAAEYLHGPGESGEERGTRPRACGCVNLLALPWVYNACARAEAPQSLRSFRPSGASDFGFCPFFRGHARSGPRRPRRPRTSSAGHPQRKAPLPLPSQESRTVLRQRGWILLAAGIAMAEESLLLTMTDLASERVGGSVCFATDEWFSKADRLICDDPPTFDPNAYTAYGKEMDGWESRRKRTAGHDWAILSLGLAGSIEYIEVDTAYFTGNQAPRISIQAAELGKGTTAELLRLRLAGARGRGSDGRTGLAASPDELRAAEALGSESWSELLPQTPLRPGYEEGRRHIFKVRPSARVTHLRVNMLPDGGIARLRCYGRVSKVWEPDEVGPRARISDLLAVENGGRSVACSNQHYGHPSKIIRPGRGIHMGDGWETARKPTRPPVLQLGDDGLVRNPGSDWCVLRLGATGTIETLIIDTNHFRGNFPESCLVEACLAGDAEDGAFADGGTALEWWPILPRTKLGPSREHGFKVGGIGTGADMLPASHLRITIFPDGGIMRVRALGRPVATRGERARRSRL